MTMAIKINKKTSYPKRNGWYSASKVIPMIVVKTTVTPSSDKSRNDLLNRHDF